MDGAAAAISLPRRKQLRSFSCFTSGRNVPVTPTPSIFPKVLPYKWGAYKWEAYCSTNGRRIAGFPFLRSLEARKVRRYKWGAYCRTNWRCTAVLFRQVVGVGVSETLPNQESQQDGRKFDHEKGQTFAISGCRLHWTLSTGLFVLSPVCLCNLVRPAP